MVDQMNRTDEERDSILIRDYPDVPEDADDYAPRNPKMAAFLGRARSGKSLSMCRFAVEAYRSGLNVWHNGGLKFGELLDPERLLALELMDGLVILDEVHRWADSRTGQRLFQRDLSNVLLQLGKLNLGIFWATHRPMLVDLRLREATDMWFICQTEDKGESVMMEIRDFNEIHVSSDLVRLLIRKDMSEYWKYYDTESLFAHMEAEEVNDRKNQRGYKEMEQVQQACYTLFTQLKQETATSSEIARLMHSWKDQGFYTLDPARVGRHMAMIGIPMKRTARANVYAIGDFFRDNNGVLSS
jgi:hypothetical protein